VTAGSEMPLGLVCSPYHRGGVIRWMVDLATEWGRVHGPVSFVTVCPTEPFVNAGGRTTTVDLVSSSGAERVELNAPRVDSRFEFGMEAHRAAVYARGINASLPVGSPLIVSSDPAVWRAAASLGGKYPLVGVLHSDEEQSYRLAERFENAAAAIVSVSRRIDRVARARRPTAAVERAVIPCGTKLQAAARHTESLPRVLRLLWVGRLDDSAKRLTDLPAIVAHAKSLGIRCHLRVVGAGHDETLLRRAIAARNVHEDVEVIGWKSTSELDVLRAEADVLLLPSNYEGMPIVVMEALAAGCAVVASRVSGVEDYVDHRDAPWCYWTHEVGDVQKAAQLVAQAARTPFGLRTVHAQAMARDLFSIEACARRYREFLQLVPSNLRSSMRDVPAPISRLISGPLAAVRRARLHAAKQDLLN
jgi:glycosyltransferase involved in cell wall biosynthesis